MIQENHNSVSILDTLSHYDSQNLLVVTRHVRQASLLFNLEQTFFSSLTDREIHDNFLISPYLTK